MGFLSLTNMITYINPEAWLALFLLYQPLLTTAIHAKPDSKMPHVSPKCLLNPMG